MIYGVSVRTTLYESLKNLRGNLVFHPAIENDISILIQKAGSALILKLTPFSPQKFIVTIRLNVLLGTPKEV
jgi:hypothetical protein